MYPTNVICLPGKAELFYQDVLSLLNANCLRYLIGGSLALAHYMHLPRCPKDLDIFLRQSDVDETMELLRKSGYEAIVVHRHWLAKVYSDELFVDLIFNSGNGVAKVDDSWFEEAQQVEIFGQPVSICRPEDIIWSKAFIMDRERFDGADITHLIRDASETINWSFLLSKFGENWQVLLAHLMLYQFSYPGDAAIPKWVMEWLLMRALSGGNETSEKICLGTLLSRDQYSCDVNIQGYTDGRLFPRGNMQEDELRDYLCAVDMEISERKRLEAKLNPKLNLAQKSIAGKIHGKKRRVAA